MTLNFNCKKKKDNESKRSKKRRNMKIIWKKKSKNINRK